VLDGVDFEFWADDSFDISSSILLLTFHVVKTTARTNHTGYNRNRERLRSSLKALGRTELLVGTIGGLYFGKGSRKMEAYCMKCKAKKEMKDAQAITMKNGRPANQGVCSSCGTKMFKIGKC
jgi:hypothetical protein